MLIDYITWTKVNFEKKESNQTKRGFFQNWINKQASLSSFVDAGEKSCNGKSKVLYKHLEREILLKKLKLTKM